MGDSPRVINITEFEADAADADADAPLSSSPIQQITANYGGGIELLMNEKRMGEKSNEVGNLDSLEHELNTLNLQSDDDDGAQPNGGSAHAIGGNANAVLEGRTAEGARGLGGGGLGRGPDLPGPRIGHETADVPSVARTWDGYENIGMSTGFDPNAPSGATMGDAKPQMTKEELLREKFACLRRLEELEKKGVRLTKNYDMDSPLSEMQGEYETIVAEKERSNSVKFQAKILMACITGIEFLNNKFDPFDIKLDGWSEQMNENVSDYDDVFSELHEKYKSKGKMAPELKLMFQVAGSAMMIHMTNTMFKSAVPGMDDIMKQNPELMQQFTRAAASSMSGTNPGFSGFMNVAQPGGRSETPPASFSGHSSGGGRRSSMRGPDREDVDSILSNMKTKISRDVQNQVEERHHYSTPSNSNSNLEREDSEVYDATDRSSNISIHELKELAGQKMPKRGRRSAGGKKEVVTVSLDM